MKRFSLILALLVAACGTVDPAAPQTSGPGNVTYCVDEFQYTVTGPDTTVTFTGLRSVENSFRLSVRPQTDETGLLDGAGSYAVEYTSSAGTPDTLQIFPEAHAAPYGEYRGMYREFEGVLRFVFDQNYGYGSALEALEWKAGNNRLSATYQDETFYLNLELSPEPCREG